MLYQQIQYLIFYFKPSFQSGVHIPFVQNLIIKCFNKKTPNTYWNSFINIKRQLLENKKTIHVTDFGAGSKIFKNKKRQVSKIAKVAGISNKKAKILLRIVSYFQPKNVLEIGTSLGLATTILQLGSNHNTKITTLEGCLETSKIAQQLFNVNGFSSINIIPGHFKETLPIATLNKEFDFIYFDGNHTKNATLNYFETCLKTVNNNSVWIFDDIYWNKEMKETWTEIKEHSKVAFTIDLFYWGIVFFQEQPIKEHFKIRVF